MSENRSFLSTKRQRVGLGLDDVGSSFLVLRRSTVSCRVGPQVCMSLH